MLLVFLVLPVNLYDQEVRDILGHLGDRSNPSLLVHHSALEVQHGLVSLLFQACQGIPFHLSLQASHLVQDLLVGQRGPLVQQDLANREDQETLVDPSVHDQADLYPPSDPSDQSSQMFHSAQGFQEVLEVLVDLSGHIQYRVGLGGQWVQGHPGDLALLYGLVVHLGLGYLVILGFQEFQAGQLSL